MLSVAFRFAAGENVPISAHFLVDCNEEHADVFDCLSSATQEAEEFKRWLKEQLRPQMEVATGFYWEVRKFSRSRLRPSEFSATMWCVSREDRTASNQTTQTENPRTAEKRGKVERYRCQGTVNVDRSLAYNRRTGELLVAEIDYGTTAMMEETSLEVLAISFAERICGGKGLSKPCISITMRYKP
ncbi:hypothetical protein R1sor_013307 [Riccia sorocarpa]|uniref:Uncharacterized protein n=1 Tax=Riccia sorocarpa TaxID=122646 RepID=A0ABD3H6B1_9MARC